MLKKVLTTVSAKVLKGEEDITSEYAASAFVWTRDTGNAEADATWNAANDGVKEFTVSAADLTDDAKFTCTLTRLRLHEASDIMALSQ